MILIPLSLATKGLVREMRRRCDIRPESRASSQQSRGYNCRDLMTSPRVENLSGVKQARHRTDKPGCSRTMARVPDNGRSAVSRPWFHYERPSRVWGERGGGGGRISLSMEVQFLQFYNAELFHIFTACSDISNIFNAKLLHVCCAYSDNFKMPKSWRVYSRASLEYERRHIHSSYLC